MQPWKKLSQLLISQYIVKSIDPMELKMVAAMMASAFDLPI
jgi:hypothetical protein